MRNIFWADSRAGRMARVIGAFMLVVGIVSLLFITSQRPAQAFCEDPATMSAGVAAAMIAQTTALMLAFLASQFCPGACGTLPNWYAVSIEATQAFLIASLNVMEDTILNKLKQFWNNWLLALKDMTAQLSGSLNDGTRHLDSLFDSSNETQNARNLQQVEHTAKKQYQPTDQGCRFDTAARYLNQTMRTGQFVSQGMTKDLNIEANNASGTPAAKGYSTLRDDRWGTYVATFCDGTSNDGYPGCTTPGTRPNADTQPSKTLFGKETIDLTNKDDRLAVQALTYNITGYDIPDPFQPEVLKTSAGKEQRMHNREYMAQMDAVTSLVTSVIGERTPGPANGAANQKGQEVQQLRQKLGITDASANPSEREVRQSVIEQLWDPNYWVDLGDSPSSTAQKEVYLQAYNLMMMYKIIEKTEKIANTYAIETANMLDRQMGGTRRSGQQYQPMK